MTKYTTRLGIDLSLAARFLRQGKVVAIPTETVYGLAANAFSAEAIAEIYRVKNRPLYNPLIVHVASMARIPEITSDIPDQALALLEVFPQGPLTLLLPKKPILPEIVTSGLPRVAVRIPSHPLTQKLLAMLAFPLAAPSANPFGYISPSNSHHVMRQLGGKIPYILEGGPCEKGIESTIIGFEGEDTIIYRMGSVTREQIEKVTGRKAIYATAGDKPQASGMLPQHYAPLTPLFLSSDLDSMRVSLSGKRLGFLLFKRQLPDVDASCQQVLSPDGDYAEAASRLYEAMHLLDDLSLDAIIAERLPDEGIARAVNDRLERAAFKHQ